MNELVSTCVAGVALIVTWLARLDSKRSAQAAQKSADAAQRATDLMSQQLELTVQEQNRTIKKEYVESLPVIMWRGGSSVQKQMNWEFENLGGDIANVSIETVDGVSASVSPAQFIQRNKTGSTTFICNRENFPFPFTFKIFGETKLGKRVSQEFRIDARKQPVLVRAE